MFLTKQKNFLFAVLFNLFKVKLLFQTPSLQQSYIWTKGYMAYSSHMSPISSPRRRIQGADNNYKTHLNKARCHEA